MGAKNPKRQERVAQLLAEGWSLTAIARELEVSIPTVWYYAQRTPGYSPNTKYRRRYDWVEVQRYYDEGHGVTACLAHFGMARKTLTDAVRRGAFRTRPQATPIEQLLTAGARRNRGNIKNRLLAAGLKHNRCEHCGIEDWRGRPLSMALHHVNGDGRDNRLENLQLLCPNCHSQTENFAGRAVVRPAA